MRNFTKVNNGFAWQLAQPAKLGLRTMFVPLEIESRCHVRRLKNTA